jgi:hypothetical protein
LALSCCVDDIGAAPECFVDRLDAADVVELDEAESILDIREDSRVTGVDRGVVAFDTL